MSESIYQCFPEMIMAAEKAVDDAFHAKVAGIRNDLDYPSNELSAAVSAAYDWHIVTLSNVREQFLRLMCDCVNGKKMIGSIMSDDGIVISSSFDYKTFNDVWVSGVVHFDRRTLTLTTHT